MKVFTKLGIVFLLCVFTTGMLWAQHSEAEIAAKMQTLNKKVASNQFADLDPNAKAVAYPASDAMFDLQWEMPVGVGGGEAGIETDGTDFIYTSKWNGAGEFYKYDIDGNYIDVFTVAGATGCRDIAYDGTHFYGGAASTTVFQMDFVTATMVSTFTTTVNVRAIAYNEDDEVFYANNWSDDISWFDMSGTVLGSFPVGASDPSYYGLAYDNYSTPGTPYLWGHSQTGATLNELIQMELPAGTETGLTFDVGGVLSAYASAGGLAISDGMVTGTYSFVGTSQNINIWAVELSGGTTLEFCYPAYTSGCNFGDGFSDFAVAEIENYGSGCADNTGITGCSDYTTLGPAFFTPGESYTVTMASGYSNQYVNIWIDFNDNEYFDADEMVMPEYWIETSATFYDVDITIPLDAAEGSHLMRAMTVYANSFTDPCGAYAYGEVEDYTVEVESLAPSYCEASTTNEDECIGDVICGDINNLATGWQGGVADYTDLTTAIVAGESEDITVNSGCNVWSSDIVHVWVDWNMDYEFGVGTDEEFILENVGATGETFTGAIMPPAGTAEGDYRMRVRMTYSTAPIPCDAASYGEVEDYTITVAGGMDYCEASTTNEDECIGDVICGDINNLATGWQGGVADYTDLTTTIAAGESEDITVNSGCNIWSSDIVHCWVDWNMDYEFGVGTDEEFILENVGSTGETYTGAIMPPAGTPEGDYRMRVRMTYSTAPIPCDAASYGEVEDYTITVGAGGTTANCEDFDGLTVGGLVAEQLGGMWTTWSGTSTDDATVSDMYSNSPDNSFIVDAASVDLVLMFDDVALDAGQWLYSNYIYVPTGFSGYFNVQGDPAPGVEWVLDLFFDDGGTGSFGTSSTETFTYNHDTWILVEIDFDLDADMVKVYFDGVMMTEFVWDGTIGGIDYYGYDANGTPGAYYDDVCFDEMSIPPPEPTCEDFDALTPGDYVALELGGNWTTWGNAPGTAEDAIVSDMYSISPSNSILVEGTTDLVHLITGDNITSGVWSYSLNIYVPDGTTGYFNLQKDVVPGTEWGFQVMFEDDMTMIVDGGAAGAAIIPYDYDTWYFCEMIVDLDADWCEFYVDDNLELGYQWTLGTFGTAGALTLAGSNIYANPGAGGTPPGAHFDDICFEELGNPPPEPTCEDFDALTPGDYVALELGGNWTTWTGAPGTAEDAIVSDMYSISPSNSILVEGTTDLVHLITGDNITSGKWSYSLNIYVPDGTTGYFNLQKDVVPGTEWGFQVMFEDDMTMVVDGGAAGAAIIPYDYDTWYLCEMVVDLDADWCEFFVDGNLELGYQWTLGTFGTAGALTLAGSNIYANPGAGGTPPGAHFDDICFMELPSQSWAMPQNVTAMVENTFDVHVDWDVPASGDPTGYNVFRDDDFIALVTETEYDDIGLEEGTYIYCVTAVYDGGESGEACADPVTVIEPTPPGPINLTGPDEVTEGTPIDLMWEAPGGGEWIHFDAGVNNGNGVGLTNGGTFSVAARWTPAEIAPYNGLSLLTVTFYANGDPDATYTLKVWTGANGTTEVYSQDIASFNVDEWNEVDLTTPVVISSAEDFWIGYEVTHLAGMFPAGSDDGPAIQYSGDMITTGGAWESAYVLTGGAIDANWNVQGWVALADGKGATQTTKLVKPYATGTDFVANGSTGVSNKFVPTADNSKDLDSYNVYRSINGAAFSVIGNTAETEYTDEDVTVVGVYDYYVTAVWDPEGESDPSNTHTVDVITGIEDVIFNSTLVYPNPASEVVNIKSDFDITMIRVFNHSGQVVAEEMVHNKMYQFNTSQYNAGMYFFQIETTEGTISKRIIVQ